MSIELHPRFCRKMARSGYTEGYREQVVKAGVAGYSKQLEASRAGGRYCKPALLSVKLCQHLIALCTWVEVVQSWG